MASLLDRLLLYNPFAKFFRTSRPEEEKLDKEQIENSVGVSQEQIDLYNVVNYDYLMSPNVTSTGVNFEQYFANKHGRVQKYKEMAFYPEVSDALDNVSDAVVVENKDGNVVDLEIVEELPSHIAEEIQKIWDYLVFDIFSFNERGWDLFRKWLIEAELYVELILNDDGNNIIGIKVLPCHTMMPVYEENKIRGFTQTKIGNPNSQDVRQQQQGSIIFDKDQIAYISYGLFGSNMLDIRGYLEAAIRTYNQLKSMEDALVVSRLIRAPERRLWNISTGRMPPAKAEEYLRSIIQKYRKKIIYNADTGEVDSTANIQSLTEDFWFAKNENGEGTTVETFQSNNNLGELNDINYFLQKLYKTLKLPRSRWDYSLSTMYSSGKSGEVLMEELRFSNFIKRLQNRFKYILINPFLTLLRLRGIDEKYINENLYNVQFSYNNIFREYEELELLESKMGVLGQITSSLYDKNTNPAGLFSKEFALKKYFMMSQEEFNENEEMKKSEEVKTKPIEGMEIGGGFGGAIPPAPEFGGGLETPPIAPTPATPPTPEAEMATPPTESRVVKTDSNVILNEWRNEDNTIKHKYKLITFSNKNINNK